MKKLYQIGKGRENDIEIRDQDCPFLFAEIRYERGHWILYRMEKSKEFLLNSAVINVPIKLVKNDKLRVYNQTIYWSNYLYEGENQELHLMDTISYNGRISRSNFRALSLLSLGLAIFTFFLPGLLIGIWENLHKQKFKETQFDTVNAIQEIAPTVYILGFTIITVIILLLGIKRIRDTGNPIWKLIIPFYNLKLLYFVKSKE